MPSKGVVHILDTWPEYFQAIWTGVKTFEARKNDRDFSVGDYLWLKEYDPNSSRHSGREIRAEVTDSAQLGRLRRGAHKLRLVVEEGQGGNGVAVYGRETSLNREPVEAPGPIRIVARR